MKRVLFLLASLCLLAQLHAQFTISGTISGSDGEKLIGANVTIANTFRGTTTDVYGKFRLTGLKTGRYLLLVSYIGYNSYQQEIELENDKNFDITLQEASLLGDEVIIKGTRAEGRTPASYSNVDKDEISKINVGQDLPVILNSLTSVVTTTDAGNGIGYTGMRIRGTDINRINVSINGIPFNDPESHSVYWVDMPDFASSIENIQIQRGVGTSSNGAAAFGATINLQTNGLVTTPFSQVNVDYGSFNTLRTNISFGTGLMKDKFTLDGRLSNISSDGFIDRAWSKLKSFYLSGGFYSGKTILRLYVFTGLEETYQAWNGVPKAKLTNDSAGIAEYIAGSGLSAQQTNELYNSNNRTYNFYTYPNQIDHYLQSHYQLHLSHQFGKHLLVNAAVHYTKGNGYYEEYKYNQNFSDYGLPDPTIGSDTIVNTDLIRRKWLDNDFYGVVSNINYSYRKFNLTIGGGWNRYLGNHFGKIIWAQYSMDFANDYEWYRGKGEKSDVNLYTKLNYEFLPKLNLYGDIQYRGIRYDITGLNDDRRDVTMQGLDFDFLNPKAGIFLQLNDQNNIFTSFAVAHREPNRSNYIDAPAGKLPTREILYDLEAGYTLNLNKFKLNLNLYNMYYRDQLVLTGEINDVGDAIMVNVPKSYRRGIEVAGELKLAPKILLSANATLSTNKIKDFTEYIDNWNYWDDPENQPLQISNYIGTTDLSFSPELIGSSVISFMPANGLTLNLFSKYISRQYVDNTSSVERSLNPYLVNDFYIIYKIINKGVKEMNFKLMINNILNEKYETNAWVYQYVYDNQRYTLDGYFPQAGINFIAGIEVKF